MKPHIRKGQASVEYSIIYSIGIVVIILAVILAWQMEAFTPATQSKGSAGFSQVEVIDQAAYLDSSRLTLGLRNDVGGNIEISRIDANIEDIYCHNSSAIVMTPGIKTVKDLKCSELSGEYSRNSYYRANVTITYTNLETGNVHHSKGKVWGGVE